MSTDSILQESPDFHRFVQTGFRESTSGKIEFFNAGDKCILSLTLSKQNCLSYWLNTTLTLSDTPPTPRVNALATPLPTSAVAASDRPTPIDPGRQLESEVWAARLGFCG